MSQVTNDVEALVAIGRIEAKLDATTVEHDKRLNANTQFQQTVQNSLTDTAAALARINQHLASHDRRFEEIEGDIKGRFTRNTVIIGIVLTGVNVGIGIFGR